MTSIPPQRAESLTEHAVPVTLAARDGAVLISPQLQGRIFCTLGDELIHRLDVELMRAPSRTEFNNLGGNSLWPAPEGGPFAFNYLHGSDEWYVQPLVAEAEAVVIEAGLGQAIIEKRGTLTNRAGEAAAATMHRKVALPFDHPVPAGFHLTGIRYFSEDIVSLDGEHRADTFLIAPWSLEQFPGGDGIIAFGAVAKPEGCVNEDYYGIPGDRLRYCRGGFLFSLGGEERHQIGVRVAHRPRLIGSLDPGRRLLIIRKTVEQGGRYFNIADNEQAEGPWSARDLFSIFNGGSLGFYELETIGALQTCGGLVATSTLQSETTILHGPMDELRRYLREWEQVDFMEAGS